jgi:hypothetical protein
MLQKRSFKGRKHSVNKLNGSDIHSLLESYEAEKYTRGNFQWVRNCRKMIHVVKVKVKYTLKQANKGLEGE